VNARLAITLSLLALVGCAQRENIPTYPNMSVADSLNVMRKRSSKIKDISGEGAITLTDPKGQSVRLDAAFVFAPPDRARVRAWKFGQAVLDLTVIPEATFLFLPRKDGHADQLRSASGDTGKAVREWLRLLSRGVDDTDDVRESGPQLIVKSPKSLVEYIDRKTLTPRRYVSLDTAGHERFSLTLDQYRTVGDTVWPMRIEANSPSGLVRIDMRDIELNNAPDTAFKPPSRAERLP
jgi:outer membrane lipoprotein-sorting protein